jgi:hypothetical protein
MEDHHSRILRPAQSLGKMPYKPSQSLRSSQILVVKWQWTKRWSWFSSVYLQSWQSPQLSQPRRLNLSAVQSLHCKANQAWFFAFGVSRSFQMILLKLDSTRPKNYNLYAEAVEYCSLAVRFQVISPSTSTRRCLIIFVHKYIYTPWIQISLCSSCQSTKVTHARCDVSQH